MSIYPYKGLLVVALEQAVAAPYCTAQLAKRGARVIKIERRGVGDFSRHYDHAANGFSTYQVQLNQAKQSLELDLKKRADDRELLHRILSKADVFVENLRPGASSRLGFDCFDLKKKYSSLITCSISGYNQDSGKNKSKFFGRKSYDLLIQAESGLSSITGARVGVPICDLLTGANAFTAIQTALFNRLKTGKACSIECSMFDSIADQMTVPLLHFENDKKYKTNTNIDLRHPTICPYGSFVSADDVKFVIAVQNEPEWKSLCSNVLSKFLYKCEGVQKLISNKHCFNTLPKRLEKREFIDSTIQSVFKLMDMSDIERSLDSATPSIAFSIINDMNNLSKHSQLRRSKAYLRKSLNSHNTDISVDKAFSLVKDPINFYNGEEAFIDSNELAYLGQHNDLIRNEFS